MRKRNWCVVMRRIPILLLLVGFQAPLAFGTPPASQEADAKTEAGEEKQKEERKEADKDATPKNPGRLLAPRVKAAKRPYNYITLHYMSVPEGGDEEYLKVETAWQQVHTLHCQVGRMLFWSLLKVENADKSPYQYITMHGWNSLDDSRRGVNWSRVRKSLGEAIDFDRLFERTGKARKVVHTEAYEIVAYEGSPEGAADLTRFGYWQPTPGREGEYVNAERNEAAPNWRKIIEVDPSFKMWGLTRLVSSTAAKKSHKYRIFHLFDTTQRPADQSGRDKIRDARRKVFEAAREEAAERPKVDWGALRKGVKYHQLKILMRTSPEDSGVAAEWKKLEGVWKHVRKDGSYRIKRITKNSEVLENYDADGKLLGKNESPMRIEIKEGINHFYVYHPRVTYHSVYKVHNGKWYEQLRGVFRNTGGAPNNFLVYERVKE